MRILHITPTYVPAYRYGGPIYAVHALCRSLAVAGHDVHVLTTSVDGSRDSDVSYDRPVDLDGVRNPLLSFEGDEATLLVARPLYSM